MCDMDCFHCVLEDCVLDVVTPEEMAAQDELDTEIFRFYKPVKFAHREAQKRYRQTEKGKEVQKRYNQSEKRKEAQKRYNQSEKRKEAHREAQKRYQEKRKRILDQKREEENHDR